MTALVEGAWPGALLRKGTWRLMTRERLGSREKSDLFLWGQARREPTE